MTVLIIKGGKLVDIFGEKDGWENLLDSEIDVKDLRKVFNLPDEVNVEILNPEDDLFMVIFRKEKEVDVLSKTDALLSAIIDSTNDAISVADTEGKIVLD